MGQVLVSFHHRALNFHCDASATESSVSGFGHKISSATPIAAASSSVGAGIMSSTENRLIVERFRACVSEDLHALLRSFEKRQLLYGEFPPGRLRRQ